MAYLHLVRHGQANSRGGDYDRLTERGFEQTALLGEYYSQAGVPVDYIASGTLRRQRETAKGFRDAYKARGRVVSEVKEFAELNEFAPELWQNLAEKISGADKDFARMLDKWRSMRATSERKAAFLFVKMTMNVVQAWVKNRFPDANVEPFPDFVTRVQSATEHLPYLKQDAHAFLFTSGTPIAVLVAASVGIQDQPERILRMMRWVYNSSVTTLYRHRGRLELVSFNTVPHLANPRSRTLV